MTVARIRRIGLWVVAGSLLPVTAMAQLPRKQYPLAGRVCTVPSGVVVPQWQPLKPPGARRQLQSARPPCAIVCTIQWFDRGPPSHGYIVLAVCEVRDDEVAL
jgi:hypothetical protein